MATSNLRTAFLTIASVVTFAADATLRSIGALADWLTTSFAFVVNAVVNAVEVAFPHHVDPWDRPVDVVAIRALDRDKPRKAFLERAREHTAYQGGGFKLAWHGHALMA